MTQQFCPLLAQRLDDIEPLFLHYLQQACLRLNHPVPELPAALAKKAGQSPLAEQRARTGKCGQAICRRG